MAKYTSTKKVGVDRAKKAIVKDTAPNKGGADFYNSKTLSNPKTIKKLTSNGVMSKMGSTVKKFFGIKK